MLLTPLSANLACLHSEAVDTARILPPYCASMSPSTAISTKIVITCHLMLAKACSMFAKMSLKKKKELSHYKTEKLDWALTHTDSWSSLQTLNWAVHCTSKINLISKDDKLRIHKSLNIQIFKLYKKIYIQICIFYIFNLENTYPTIEHFSNDPVTNLFLPWRGRVWVKIISICCILTHTFLTSPYPWTNLEFSHLRQN